MNKQKLRELFEGITGDVRDYYDAQRDMLESQRKILEKVVAVASEVFDDGVISKGETTSVVVPPEFPKVIAVPSCMFCGAKIGMLCEGEPHERQLSAPIMQPVFGEPCKCAGSPQFLIGDRGNHVCRNCGYDQAPT